MLEFCHPVCLFVHVHIRNMRWFVVCGVCVCVSIGCAGVCYGRTTRNIFRLALIWFGFKILTSFCTRHLFHIYTRDTKYKYTVLPLLITVQVHWCVFCCCCGFCILYFICKFIFFFFIFTACGKEWVRFVTELWVRCKMFIKIQIHFHLFYVWMESNVCTQVIQCCILTASIHPYWGQLSESPRILNIFDQRRFIAATKI